MSRSVSNGFKFARLDLDVVAPDVKTVSARGPIKQTDKVSVGELIELRIYIKFDEYNFEPDIQVIPRDRAEAKIAEVQLIDAKDKAERAAQAEGH